MKLLLVHAAFPITYWGFQHSLRIVDKRAALPPLGLVSVAALLPKEWTLRLVDVNVEPLDDEALAWADVVLVSGMLVQKESILEIVARARALGRRTIVGGPACTTSPQLFEDADHVFCGEVEERVDALLAAIERPGAPHVLGGIPDIRPKLASVPTPRHDLLDLRAYRSMSLQYSRGCPYACEFCDIVEVFGRVPRTKPTPAVLAELDSLFQLGWRGQVFFVDDNFIGNKKAVRSVLPEIERWQEAHGFPFSFYTEASVNLARDPELLAAMTRAGFESVFVGLETPSPEALRASNKTQNIGVDLAEAVDTITRAGIEVMGGFIVGFDADDAATFELQRAFIADSPIPLAMVGMLTALPGTALHRRLEKEGRLVSHASGDQFGRPNFAPRMGEQALLDGYARLMAELYSPRGYFARVTRLVDRLGAPPRARKTTLLDVMIVLRAIVLIGILGDRRAWFWRTLARAIRRGPHTIRVAISHSVMAEHMIRYTCEHVLPRVRSARADAPVPALTPRWSSSPS